MKKLLLILLIMPSLAAFSQTRVSPVRTKAEVLNEKYCSPLFATAHGEYFDLTDDRVNSTAIAYYNILDWLHGRVAGLRVYNTRYDVRIPFIRNQRASVYVNEMPVSYDYLNSLPVTDIAMIKVIKGPFVGNWGGGMGAIAIYTLGNEEEPEPEPTE